MLSSHGCITCKTRRIKCDRSLTRCQRCIKSNRLCVMRDDVAQVPSSNKTTKALERRKYPCLLSHSVSHIPELLALDSVTHRKELFIQWRRTQTPWMQSAIDHLVANFVFNADDCSLLVNSSNNHMNSATIEVFDIVLSETGPGRTVIDVVDVLAACLLIIRTASAQTVEGRREQHAKYRLAIRKLRESISQYPKSETLIAPVYLFALYEMIVNTHSNDMAWKIHLGGLQAMLQQENCSLKGETTTSTTHLIAANQFMESEQRERYGLQAFLELRPPMDNNQKAWRLVDMSKMRLKNLIANMDRLRAATSFGTERNDADSSFRKLEIDKLRVSVKQIQRDLLLVPDLIPKECHPARVSQAHLSSDVIGFAPYYHGYYEDIYPTKFLCAKWNEYRSILLLVSDFLLKAGHFLHSGTSRRKTRETNALSRNVKEAVDGICATVAYCYDRSTVSNDGRCIASFSEAVGRTLENQKNENNNDFGDDKHCKTMRIMDALVLTWSLHCAIAMCNGIPADAQREWMKRVLGDIGCRMSIPKATALANVPAEETSYSDALASFSLLGSRILRIA